LDDPVEKILAERLEICYVEGKKKKGSSRKNNLVPILFTEECVSAINIIVKCTKKHDDDYIFSSGDLYLSGWDTLQGICKKIENLEKPNLINPTRTRKYMSTMLQLLDMSKAELNWVTNHFGHTKNVHFAWYRKEDATIELTKMARVLVAVDSGEKIKNKKIDNVGCTSEQATSGEVIEECHEFGQIPVIANDVDKETAENDVDKETAENENMDFEMVEMQKPQHVIKRKPDDSETFNVFTKKKQKGWNPWTQKELDLLKKVFKYHYIKGVVPTVFDTRT